MGDGLRKRRVAASRIARTAARVAARVAAAAECDAADGSYIHGASRGVATDRVYIDWWVADGGGAVGGSANAPNGMAANAPNGSANGPNGMAAYGHGAADGDLTAVVGAAADLGAVMGAAADRGGTDSGAIRGVVGEALPRGMGLAGGGDAADRVDAACTGDAACSGGAAGRGDAACRGNAAGTGSVGGATAGRADVA